MASSDTGECATAFKAAFRASSPGTQAFVIDVGANDGSWSLSWAQEKVSGAIGGRSLEVHMIEPQRNFRASLSTAAARHNFTFVSAAASRADGEMTFYSKAGASRSGSTVASSVRDDGREAYTVPSIDLASYLRKSIPRNSLTLVKIDLEGLEYDLLPWLLLHGSLCVSHLLIEWHLVSQPIGSRLEALALRHSVERLLRSGCDAPPAMIDTLSPALNKDLNC